MFKGDKNAKNEGHDRLNRIVGGAAIKGNLMTKSNLRLDGLIEGDVECVGKLVLGEEGSIRGEVKVQEAEVYGKITGNVTCVEVLILHKTAQIFGNVSTQRIVIEDGAKIEGQISTQGAHYSTTAKPGKEKLEVGAHSDSVY